MLTDVCAALREKRGLDSARRAFSKYAMDIK